MKQQNKLLWRLSSVILVVVLLFCILSDAPAQTVPQIAEKALAVTVSLEMQDRNGVPLGRGSGFFVRPNLIATNYHVIEGAVGGTTKLVGQDTIYTIEGFTATDKTNDLALLKVTIQGIKPLSLGDSDAVQIGETVYVVGNPLGFEGTFSDGIISGRRNRDTKEHLQMTAPISPGSSGGPVLNRKGEVIGVSMATHSRLDAQNLNFAIPSNYLKILLERTKPVKKFSQENQSISADTYFFRGNVNYQSGLYWAAIGQFNAAIHLEPDFADAYHNRGLAKIRLGKYTTAITDYDTVIRLKPNDAGAYLNRGKAQCDLGQHFGAIADYNTAIRLKPDYAKAYYNRAIAKQELARLWEAKRGRRLWEAKQDLRTALKLAIRDGNNSLKTDIEEVLKIIDR